MIMPCNTPSQAIVKGATYHEMLYFILCTSTQAYHIQELKDMYHTRPMLGQDNGAGLVVFIGLSNCYTVFSCLRHRMCKILQFHMCGRFKFLNLLCDKKAVLVTNCTTFYFYFKFLFFYFLNVRLLTSPALPESFGAAPFLVEILVKERA